MKKKYKKEIRMSSREDYQISFGIEKEEQEGNKKNQRELEIPEKNVQIEGDFTFHDYNLNATIGYLKEFFLTTFGQKYKYCKCVLYVFYEITPYFLQTKYRLLSNSDEKKLRDFQHGKLFLIKRNTQCNCEFKLYTKYMNMKKFDVIAKLKNLDVLNFQLQEEIKRLKKSDELKYHNYLNPEEFYDIVIDINSIKNINREGWQVIFNEKGKQKCIEHKDQKEQKSIILGVLGNNNKGKSFILSKISEIKLLTGASIETKGLSIKYPELEGFKHRQLILLDSAGLETPVLKKEDNEINKEEVDKDKQNEINKEEDGKDKQNEINKEEVDKDKQNEINKGEVDKDKQNEIINISEKNILPNQNQNNEENQQNEKDEKSKEKSQLEEKPKMLDDKEKELNKEFRENARDKIMTELFLQHFIIRVSDILLIVVGKLTYSEQLLINKIKVESKKQNKGRIFIIHNLQGFRTVEQVQDYIKNILLKCSTFDLKRRTCISTKMDVENKKEKNDKEGENNNEINEENVKDDSQLINIHFTEILNYDDKKKLEIYHLILANEDSEAGKVYNQYAYDFIKNVFNLIPESKKFDIFEQVIDNFKKLSGTILNDDIEEYQFNKDIIKDKKIQLNRKEHLTLKKCYTDELGFSFFKTGDFEPKYNYFTPDENILEIRLEVPGKTNITTSHRIVGDETIVTIKGTKHKDKQPSPPKYNLFNIREFSDFELNIPLKAEKYKITGEKPKEGYPKFNNGICLIQYDLAKKGKEIEASPKDADGL